MYVGKTHSGVLVFQYEYNNFAYFPKNLYVFESEWSPQSNTADSSNYIPVRGNDLGAVGFGLPTVSGCGCADIMQVAMYGVYACKSPICARIPYLSPPV